MGVLGEKESMPWDKGTKTKKRHLDGQKMEIRGLWEIGGWEGILFLGQRLKRW
jgi:hypothetical protein